MGETSDVQEDYEPESERSPICDNLSVDFVPDGRSGTVVITVADGSIDWAIAC